MYGAELKRKRQLNRTIHRIKFGEADTLARNKRSFHPGVIFRVLKWAFGSWSDEADDRISVSRSMGVVTHSIKAFKNVESQLQKREKFLGDELSRLEKDVKEDESKESYQNKIFVQLLSVNQLVLKYILDVEKSYAEA